MRSWLFSVGLPDQTLPTEPPFPLRLQQLPISAQATKWEPGLLATQNQGLEYAFSGSLLRTMLPAHSEICQETKYSFYHSGSALRENSFMSLGTAPLGVATGKRKARKR